MVANNNLAVIGQHEPSQDEWSEARKQFILKTFCGGADEKTAGTFLELCQRRRLSPEARHVYLVNRAAAGKAPNWVIQTGIDGYRLIADRTGRYAGSDDPVFVHDPEGRPAIASVTVRKVISGSVVGSFTASARWDEYAAGSPLWNKMPHTMLAKCAEALALRKAFPEELSGMYTDAEMDQADAPAPRRVVNRTTGEILEARVSVAPGPVQEAEKPILAVMQAQLQILQDLKERKGLTDAGIKALHGKRSAKDLTFDEAYDLIKTIEGYPDIVLDVEPDDVDADEAYQASLMEATNADRHTR